MMPAIYLIIFVAWAILIIGLIMKDYWIAALSSLLLMALGVYILATGLEGITNLATQGLGAIHIGVGGYVLIRGMVEQIARK